MATDLGLVGIVNKGPYNPNETYYQGNFVYNSNNNSTWLLKAVSATGSEPTENNTNWQLLAKGIIPQAFTGATSSANGVMGQVPAPLIADIGKFLNADGTWKNVPNPQTMQGATSSEDGEGGLVPKPTIADKDKVLKGDGSWASVGADDNFVGTLAQWNALSLADQIKYKTADITDDFNGSPIDSALSDTSTNPVQNKVVTEKINILIRMGNWRTGLRFKNLGTSFTAEQQAALAADDFTELWNGDYWTINNRTCRIVDNSNYQYGRGDTKFAKPGLVIMYDSNPVYGEAYLIDNANNSGHGYANCAYRTRTDGKGREYCKSIFVADFGANHIATHREMMSTNRGAGGATAWNWQDADVELPSEVNIYGHPVWGSAVDTNAYGTKYNIGDRWGQWKLFELAPYMAIHSSQNYWLRDITADSRFASWHHDGCAADREPSATNVGVRPYAILV